MTAQVNPVPEKYHAVTPNLVCRDTAGAIEFYKSVFGATEIARMPGPGGKIIHAELKIADSTIFLNDALGKLPALPESGASNPMYIHLYVPDADVIFDAAVAAGSRVDMPLQNMFWGDRYGKLTDPFGQQWSIATHIEDVAPEEIKRRQEAFFSKTASQAKAAGQH